MEITQENTLLYGSNHFDFYENVTGFLDTFQGDKLSIGKNILDNTFGLDSFSYLLEATNENEIHQNLHTEKADIDYTYSLDDIIDFETEPTITNSLDAIFDTDVSSPGSSSTSSYDILDTPVASPLSHDPHFYDLISYVSPGEILQDNSYSIPHGNLQGLEQEFKAVSPLSVDSGFSSDDDYNTTNTAPLMLQLLGCEQTPTKQSTLELGHPLSDQILQFIEDIDNEENPKMKNEPSFLTVNASDINIDITSMNGAMPVKNKITFPEVKHEVRTAMMQTKHCEVKEPSKAGKVRAQSAKRKGRTPEQKLRKKAQNRKAASRYREKKKDEMGDIFVGVAELEEQNTSLKDKVSGLEKEINYLKELMMDVLKARAAKSNAV